MRQTVKTHSHDDNLEEKLRDPAFREEYEALAGEFAVAKEIIRVRNANPVPRIAPQALPPTSRRSASRWRHKSGQLLPATRD